MVVKLTFPPKIVGINRVILRDGRKIISDTEKVALQSFLWKKETLWKLTKINDF